MTPKEKAYNIFGKMYYEIENSTAGLFEEEVPYEMARKTATKQCALIAVDEIWKELESERVFEKYDYWQEVKQEIEKL